MAFIYFAEGISSSTSTVSPSQPVAGNVTTTTISMTILRLEGGPNNMSGRIEIFHNGEWGTVCDDGFGHAEAKVACGMLGFMYV